MFCLCFGEEISQQADSRGRAEIDLSGDGDEVGGKKGNVNVGKHLQLSFHRMVSNMMTEERRRDGCTSRRTNCKTRAFKTGSAKDCGVTALNPVYRFVAICYQAGEDWASTAVQKRRIEGRTHFGEQLLSIDVCTSFYRSFCSSFQPARLLFFI